MFHLLYAAAAAVPADDARWAARAAAAGLAVSDLRSRCAPGRLTPLVRGEDEAPLLERAEALRRLGDGAVVLDEATFRRARPARLVRAVRETTAGLELRDAAGGVFETLPHGTRGQLIVAGLETRVLPLPTLPAAAAGRAGAPDTTFRLARLLARGHAGLVLDLTWEGARDRYRFRGGRFQMASLGRDAGPSAARNWRALVERLSATSGALRLDLDFDRVAPPARGPVVISEETGGAWDHPRSEAEFDFEHYCRWVQAAWRAGLWPDAGREGAPGASGPGDADGQAATPGGAPRRLPRLVPFHRRSAFERGCDRVAAWGSPAFLAPLFVVAVVASALLLGGIGEARVAAGVAGFAVGGMALVHAAVLFGRRRRIEDVPTSRIRSAALGAVEIAGRTEALHPLCTPFTLVPCVYYEFHVAIEVRSQPRTGTDGTGTLRVLLDRGEVRGRDREYSGRSGAIPFLVRDETGALEVDPEGARMDVAQTQVLHNPPLAAGMAGSGESVIVTERFIPVGSPVHVSGELWSRPFDEPAPDGRTSRPVLARPGSGAPFVISERSERQQVDRLTIRLFLALVIAALALFGAAVALSRPSGG